MRHRDLAVGAHSEMPLTGKDRQRGAHLPRRLRKLGGQGLDPRDLPLPESVIDGDSQVFGVHALKRTRHVPASV